MFLSVYNVERFLEKGGRRLVTGLDSLKEKKNLICKFSKEIFDGFFGVLVVEIKVFKEISR